GLGIPLANDRPTQITIAAIILASTTLLNIFGVRLVSIVNNTGVVFEILGMVVFAIILLIFYRHQSPAVVFDTSALGSGCSNLPSWAANLYLLVVAAAIYICCLAIQTSTIRLAFGMARDGKLPFGRYYNKVNASLHTPVGTSIIIGLLSAIPLLYYSGAGIVAIAATG